MNTTEILARHSERHALADSLLFNAAVFVADGDRRRYVIEVRGYVIGAPVTLADVKAFCAMHNGRMSEALSG